MKENLIFLIITLTIFTSCNQTLKSNQKSSVDTISTEAIESKTAELKTIQLDFDFVVKIGQEEDFDNFKTYTFFQLTRANAVIIVDSTVVEYEFEDTLYPIILKTGENSFELLFEINNRPNKSYLKRFFVKDNKLVGQDKLPTFEAKPKDLNNDGIKEYAGIWDYSEVWGDNNNVTDYNPILYYSVTTTGLKLDSTHTRQRNELIYGKFYGFSFDEKIEQPISVGEKFKQEMNLIK